MEIVKYVIMAIYAIVCVSLIVLATKSKEDGGASGTIVGASSNNFYEKNKGKTAEGKMKRATIALMIAFAVLTVVLGIIFVV